VTFSNYSLALYNTITSDGHFQPMHLNLIGPALPALPHYVRRFQEIVVLIVDLLLHTEILIPTMSHMVDLYDTVRGLEDFFLRQATSRLSS
jgi:hypothetical protein